MAISHATVEVTDEPTPISVPDPDSTLVNTRYSMSVQNKTDGATVYLGGPDVTTDDYGFALVAGNDWSIDLGFGEVVYGVVASGSQDVNVMVQGD